MTQQIAKPKSKKLWVILAAVAITIFTCFGACAVSMGGDDKPAIVNLNTPDQTATSDQQPVTVTGNGSKLVEIGAILNGKFKVEYAAGSQCIIAHFLKSDGSEASGFAENINECNFDQNPTGSTLVGLKDATMIQVENTQGDWSLTFTPLS